jgi:hypothetical protein
MLAIGRVQEMLSFISSLIPLYDIVIMYIVHVVSCVRISRLSAVGYCACSYSKVLLVLTRNHVSQKLHDN